MNLNHAWKAAEWGAQLQRQNPMNMWIHVNASPTNQQIKGAEQAPSIPLPWRAAGRWRWSWWRPGRDVRGRTSVAWLHAWSSRILVTVCFLKNKTCLHESNKNMYVLVCDCVVHKEIMDLPINPSVNQSAQPIFKWCKFPPVCRFFTYLFGLFVFAW